jgi:hypothetical protein
MKVLLPLLLLCSGCIIVDDRGPCERAVVVHHHGPSCGHYYWSCDRSWHDCCHPADCACLRPARRLSTR